MRLESETVVDRVSDWSLAKIGYVVFGLGSCPQKLAFGEDSSY